MRPHFLNSDSNRLSDLIGLVYHYNNLQRLKLAVSDPASSPEAPARRESLKTRRETPARREGLKTRRGQPLDKLGTSWLGAQQVSKWTNSHGRMSLSSDGCFSSTAHERAVRFSVFW